MDMTLKKALVTAALAAHETWCGHKLARKSHRLHNIEGLEYEWPMVARQGVSVNELVTKRRSSPHLSLVTLLLTSACATTPYETLGKKGGYFDYRITKDIFAIGFHGNTATREETVDLYILRRAAEVAIEHGFQYFVVLSEKGRTRSGSVGYSGFKLPVIAPAGTCQIKCFRERPQEPEIVIDAAQFLKFNFPEAIDDEP